MGMCGIPKRTGFDFNDGNKSAENPEQNEKFSVFLIPLRIKIRIPLQKMNLHYIITCVLVGGRRSGERKF